MFLSGWTHIECVHPTNRSLCPAPAWAENSAPPAQETCRNTSVFCAGVTNLMLRAIGGTAETLLRWPKNNTCTSLRLHALRVGCCVAGYIPCDKLTVPDPMCGQVCGLNKPTRLLCAILLAHAAHLSVSVVSHLKCAHLCAPVSHATVCFVLSFSSATLSIHLEVCVPSHTH